MYYWLLEEWSHTLGVAIEETFMNWITWRNLSHNSKEEISEKRERQMLLWAFVKVRMSCEHKKTCVNTRIRCTHQKHWEAGCANPRSCVCNPLMFQAAALFQDRLPKLPGVSDTWTWRMREWHLSLWERRQSTLTHTSSWLATPIHLTSSPFRGVFSWVSAPPPCALFCC